MPWSILRELLFVGVALLLLSTLANAILGLVVDLVDRQRPQLGGWIDAAWSLALALLLYPSPGPRWLLWATGSTGRLVGCVVVVVGVSVVLLWRVGQELQYRREFAWSMTRAWAAGLWEVVKYLVRGTPPHPQCSACGESPHPGARFCHTCGKPAAEEP